MNPAKTHPPGQGRILHRERLMSRLLNWEDRKLVLVHAQAGQGKSTLAAEYVRSLGAPSVWYNVDREDDNPDLFLSCFGKALQLAFPDLYPRVPFPPRSSLAPGGLPGQSIRRSVEQVFAPLTRSCLIVFDDFSTAPSSPALLSLLGMIVDETPPHVRVMVLSRTRPEFQVGGLRARRDVGEITGDDLRFSDSETLDLFNSVFGMPVGAKEAEMINRNAEGWPAGLVLLHEYLSSLDPDAWTGALEKKDFQSHIYDYLAQEVFTHLPGHLQQFLLRTSVARYLPFPLMEELWKPGRKGSCSVPALVDQLRARNLFVSAHDRNGRIIRYHSLFRDFLRKKLHASGRPADIRAFYCTAAGYFKRTGDRVHAIDLMLESGQFERALHWIETATPELIAAGHTGTMMRWQESLPSDRREQPWFLLSRAVSCRFTEPATALALFDTARSKFSAEAVRNSFPGQALALCGMIEACFHTGGDFARMERLAAEAQRLLRGGGSRVQPSRARLLLATGMAWFFTGRLQESSAAILKAFDLFRLKKDLFYQVTCALYLAPCALYQGDFRLAREALARGFEAQAAIPEEAGGKAALLVIKGMTALFEGNFQEAQESIDQCNKLTDVHALQSIGLLSLDIEGWLKIAQGEYAEAERLLLECKRRGEGARNPFFSASAAHLLAIKHLFTGNLEQAKSESDYALGIRSQSGSRLFHAIYLIAGGAIHLKLGKPRQAEKELLSALAVLQKIKALQQEANAHLMLALLYKKRRNPAAASKHLRQGFAIGRRLGFTYYALLTSEELSDLAREAADQNICTDYCKSLMDGRSAGVLLPLLTVHCLGGFRVFRGKTLIKDTEWKSRRAKTLLKLLAAHDGERVAREQIIEVLWPDAEPEHGRPVFNSMLHRLRKVIEPPSRREVSCIYLEDDVIALNKDRVWTDVRQFRYHRQQAQRLKAAGRSRDLLAEYERMIDLYRGDFLPENPYMEWTTEVRDRLRAEYLRVLEEAAALAGAMGEKGRSLRLYEKLFLEDSCSEKACRSLMVRYLGSGLRSHAIRTYERCERALSRELDLEPEEKTKQLYRNIIGG